MNFSMNNNNNNVRIVHCGERNISYILTRKKVKNVNLRIGPDGLVRISAPSRVSIKFIEDFILEKRDFIFKNLDRYASRSAAPELPEAGKIYRSGSTLRLWGQDLVLETAYAERKNESVSADEKHITVYASEEERTGTLLKNFYYSQIEKTFTEMNRKTYLMFRAKGYDVPLAEIKIRRMTSRWGSCHYTEGKIVMNSRLALYPDICAAYVFVHEYAHFIVPDHSAEFYAVLTDIMPDHKICRRILKY